MHTPTHLSGRSDACWGYLCDLEWSLCIFNYLYVFDICLSPFIWDGEVDAKWWMHLRCSTSLTDSLTCCVLRSSSLRLGISMDRISKVENSDEMRCKNCGLWVVSSCEIARKPLFFQCFQRIFRMNRSHSGSIQNTVKCLELCLFLQGGSSWSSLGCDHVLRCWPVPYFQPRRRSWA